VNSPRSPLSSKSPSTRRRGRVFFQDVKIVSSSPDTLKNQARLCPDGVNGVYFLSGTQEDSFMGVFKPREEEAFGPSNPKDKVGILGYASPIKRGIIVGDSAMKEVAAYKMDHKGLARVPETASLELDGRYGSLQRFVNSKGCAEDYNPSLFSTKDVHAIGLLDLRLFNLDRHLGNILVNTEDYTLIPIDHGYCLPDFRDLADSYFDWSVWPQTWIPFSPQVKQYIGAIDIWDDAETLQRVGIRLPCIITYLLCTIFVKICVGKNYSLRAMVDLMQRSLKDPDSPSVFESIVFMTWESNPFDSEGSLLTDACLHEFVRTFEDAVIEYVQRLQ